MNGAILGFQGLKTRCLPLQIEHLASHIYDQAYVAVASFRWTILSCLVHMLMNQNPGTLVDRNKMASV